MKSVKQVSIHEYILTQRYKSFFASKIICSKTGLFYSFIQIIRKINWMKYFKGYQIYDRIAIQNINFDKIFIVTIITTFLLWNLDQQWLILFCHCDLLMASCNQAFRLLKNPKISTKNYNPAMLEFIMVSIHQ